MEFLQESPRSPDENSRIPKILGAGDVFLGGGLVGLLAKLIYFENAEPLPARKRLALVDVTIAGRWPRRRDAERDERIRMLDDELLGGVHDAAKLLSGLDDVIGGHDEHDAVWVTGGDQPRSEGDAGSGVARSGFADDLVFRNVRQLADDFVAMVGRRHNPRIRRRDLRLDALRRHLQERAFARERDELLRFGPSAPRPEPGSTTAGHDQGMKHE